MWSGAVLALTVLVVFTGCGAPSSVGGALRTGLGLIGGGSSRSSSAEAEAAAACGGGDTLEIGGSSSSRARGASVEMSWPTADEWDMYDLKGLSQPLGSTVSAVMLVQGTYHVSLENAGQDAFTNIVSQVRSITGARAPYSDIKTGEGQVTQFQYGANKEHLISISADFVEMVMIIQVMY